MLAFFASWFSTLGLIFGGCCSNAITLEQLTSQYPHSGTLITFFQFLLISLYGLPKHIMVSPHTGLPRMRPRNIPLTPYFAQVSLFYLISLLNNAAFAYTIPMPVHIIFRSGGLVVSLALGLIVGKRYTFTQVSSVLVVTLGVILTTLSARADDSGLCPSTMRDRWNGMTFDTSSLSSYGTGISLLSFALLLSGLLGLVQDWTWKTYGRPTNTPASAVKEAGTPPPWLESLFYIHFLPLPLFVFLRDDLAAQFAAVNSGPKMCFSSTQGICAPTAYVPLLLNTFTQLLCVAGVHRLNARVSALSVTLTLAVRKAVSMVISVVWMNGQGSNTTLWIGGALVLGGSIAYSLGSGGVQPETKPDTKPELKRE